MAVLEYLPVSEALELSVNLATDLRAMLPPWVDERLVNVTGLYPFTLLV
jgi:hypothetical protein